MDLENEDTKPDTLNRFGVTVHGEKIVVLMLCPGTGVRTFTRAEAMNLAAWLVTMCDLLPPRLFPEGATSELCELVEAIRAS